MQAFELGINTPVGGQRTHSATVSAGRRGFPLVVKDVEPCAGTGTALGSRSVWRGVVAVRWRLRRRSGRLVIPENTGYFAKNTLLLLGRIAFGGIGLLLIGSLAHWGRKDFRAAQPKNAREKSSHAALLVAGFPGFSASDKGSNIIVRTCWRSQAVGCFIQLHINHTCGLGERLHAGILRQGGRLLHEFGPNGGGSLRTTEAQIAIVVITDPNDAEQVGGASRDPAVVRAAGLPRRRSSKTATADRRETQPIVDDPFHHVGHDVSDPWVKNPAFVGAEVGHHIALGAAHGIHQDRRKAHAIICKRGVRTRHIEGRSVIRTERHRRSGLHGGDAPPPQYGGA